jgi:hypothetical protein
MMHSLKEVKSKFQEMIDRQKKMLDALATEKQALLKDREKAENELSDAVDAFLPALDDGALESLSAAGTRNFTAIARELTAADATNRAEYKELGDRYKVDAGKLGGLFIEALNAEKNKKDALQTAKREGERIDEALAGIRAHNEAHPEAAIKDDKSLQSYRGFSLWSWATDGAWRSAHDAAKAYVPATEGFAADEKAAAQNAEARQKLEAKLGSLQDYVKDLKFAAVKVDELNKAYKGPGKILETVRAAVEQELIAREEFAKALAATFGENAVRPLALGALKVRNLDKIGVNLDAQEKAAEATLKKLEDPMAKISRGARNAPSKQIDIDLAGIEKAVNTGRAYAGYNLVSATQARNGISSYQPSHDDSMFNFNNLMLWYLLFNSNTDAAYTHHTLGIDQGTADKAGIDLGHLKPDIGGTLAPEHVSGVENLSPQTNDVLQGIDVPALHVPGTGTAPDLSPAFDGAAQSQPDGAGVSNLFNPASGADPIIVPDTALPSVPDISTSVPDISTSIPDTNFTVPDVASSIPDVGSSFDSSSSGSSYDSGSSYSSSYDSGSSYSSSSYDSGSSYSSFDSGSSSSFDSGSSFSP